VADITTLPDLRTLDSEGVSVVIGQDGDNNGAALFASTGKSVGIIGLAMGAISVAKVNESIAWVGKFPLAHGGEYDVPAFANGQLVRDLTPGELDGLNEKGYIFLIKHVGLANTYFNDSHTATDVTSDYSTIESNRTIDKAIRSVRVSLLPYLNGPVEVDATTGRLSETYIEFLKGEGDNALAQMARDGELSGFQTVIDPTQNVLSTGIVEVSIENVPVGVSRNFRVKIGYVKKLSA
jgi:hypothetical protein